ncbi:MAG: redox-sensing transcriptional repressor Rex [Firmicutes bacterium]|nr:redox-sensing transcriptional repressor Rex [Bacillota bacterium]MCL5039445.1 redox-sensing transcriptional repressor Rex [Bacillota bacterium]
MRKRKIPQVVVERMAVYLRILNEMDTDEPDRYISSQDLGDLAGVGAAQVRKDLALFGEFGKQGVGYQVRLLQDELKRIMNVDRPINVGIIGVGELGTALARYNLRRSADDKAYPFRMAALFDNNPAKTGRRVESLEIFSAEEVVDKVKEYRIKLMMITVPASAAQTATDLSIKAGIKAILNFAPVKLIVPPQVKLLQSDVSLQLHHLAFYL